MKAKQSIPISGVGARSFEDAMKVITKTKSTPKAIKKDQWAWEAHPMTHLLGSLSKDDNAQVAELEGLLRRRK